MTSSVSLQILGFAIVAGLGLIPAIVAEEKGRPFGWWWLYGLLFFPLALPHAILAEDGPRFVRRYRFLRYATLHFWKSYFGVKSISGDHDLGASWVDLRMQQASGNSGTPARPSPEPPNGNSRSAGWRFDDRDLHVQRDLDLPTWSDSDCRGIRFPFISIVSVLALTMLATAGAYEIAAGGWPALSGRSPRSEPRLNNPCRLTPTPPCRHPWSPPLRLT